MAIQFTRDQFQRHDPIEFDEAKKAELREKHGLVPYWANLRWRNTRRGWGTLDPIEVSDPRFPDVYACLLNKPRNPKRLERDGFYQQGDSVLAVQTVEDWELSQARRDYYANRRAMAMREGNPVASELQFETRTQNIETYTPFIRHTDEKGRDRLGGSVPGQPVRGFVKMPGPAAEPVPTFDLAKPEGEAPPRRRGRPRKRT